jgi:hypothetical protein
MEKSRIRDKHPGSATLKITTVLKALEQVNRKIHLPMNDKKRGESFAVLPYACFHHLALCIREQLPGLH